MRCAFGLFAAAALLSSVAPAALAQAPETVRTFEIAAGPMDQALISFGRQSGMQLLYPGDVPLGMRSQALSGRFTPSAALSRLLEGSGLGFRYTRANVVTVFRISDQADLDSEEAVVEEIVVTGSYLRGAQGASPVRTITSDEIDRRGHATVAEALAALPQNFGGTANEGTAATSADRSSSNSGFASGVNLRGLGADATLVLVNGRRMAGTGIAGDFSDVSTLPSSAVERVEVLLDGASALYGSDAVGGVVNVILRDRFDGAESRLRIGSNTDGASRSYQASHTAGRNWSASCSSRSATA